MGAMQCPKCGHNAVVFEEDRRTVTQYNIVSDEDGVLVVAPGRRKTEVIDSMGNEDRLRCLACGGAFDFDYEVYEDGTLSADVVFVDELRERKGWDEDAVVEALDSLVHELASRHGSNINNGGLLEQVSYILRELGDKDGRKEIERTINDITP
jgi:hypothetical protein